MISAEKKQSQHKVGLFLGVGSGRKSLCIVDIGLGWVRNGSSLFSTEQLSLLSKLS